jgi:hypothetical protein
VSRIWRRGREFTGRRGSSQPSEVGLRIPFLDPAASGDHAELHRTGPITILVNTSDAGADQLAAGRHLVTSVQPGRAAMILQLCMQHQLHLSVQKNLQRQGASKYVSRLAMICHLWRAPGMLGKIRRGFADKFDEATARRCSATAPPTPVRGRWGSVHLSECFVLRCTWSQLRSVPRSQLLIAP